MDGDVQVVGALGVVKVHNPLQVLALGRRDVIVVGHDLHAQVLEAPGDRLDHLPGLIDLIDQTAGAPHIQSMPGGNDDLHWASSTITLTVSQSSFTILKRPLVITTMQRVPLGRWLPDIEPGSRSDATSCGLMSISCPSGP